MTDLHKAANQALALLELIKHATAPSPNDGGGHENAHELAERAIAALREALAAPVVPECNQHPKAPHGFNRNASHSADRYVCDCASWEPYDAGYQAGFQAGLAAPVVPEWVAVSEKMPEPGVPVLACYTNHLGNTRRIRAFWTPANTTESGDDSDIGVYDEATDTYYDPAGWYECMDNWDEYSAIFVNEGEVTHWMPLPAAPKPKEQT